MLAFAAIKLVLLLCSAILTFQPVCGQSSDDITYVQPQRSIRCQLTDDPCKINLTVSDMHTLNAYCVNVDNTRGGDSLPVTVNEEGGFDFVYGASSVSDTCRDATRLFQPIVADGVTQRNLLVVNDQLPGPILIGYKNQRVVITVINDLGKEAITLHWHGQHVNGSQFMDGVPFVTQCPIQPGDIFVYDFRFFPAGTYWYHSHQFDERSNGMYGALVVLDPDAPNPDPRYDFDNPEQHTIAFFEWFPFNSDEWIEASYTLADPTDPSTPYSPTTTIDGSEAGGGDPPFIAGLMNSGGWRYTPSASDCRRVANTTLSFFNVTQGSSYRFRLVGSQVDFAYRFSISGHRLRVIATDGIDATVPSSITDLVDFIIIHVGERYDFVLEASESVDNYLMIAETLENPAVLMNRSYCIKAHRVYGVLHYNGASDILLDDFDDSYDPLTRCDSGPECYALNCPFQSYPSAMNIQCISVVNLQLTTPDPVPTENVNPSLFLNFGFTRFGPSINGRTFSIPTSPLLTQSNEISENLFCNPSEPPFNPLGTTTVLQCVDAYDVETDAVEFVYTNIMGVGTSHPVHLHGHHYYILDIGYPIYNSDGTINSSNPNIVCAESSCNTSVIWSNNNTPPPSPCMETNTCPLKDTVIIPVGGYVRIRFPRNNWGWWIMHCHIEPHLLGGMALVVNETSFQGNAVDRPAGFPTCGNFPPLVPITPTEGNLSTLSQELDQYRNATIALGVISSLFLLALIVMVIVVIGTCVGKKGGGGHSSKKVEVELR